MIRRWFGAAAAALGVGLAVSFGQAVANADPGDATSATAPDERSAGPSGNGAATRSTGSAVSAARIGSSPRAASPGSARLRPRSAVPTPARPPLPRRISAAAAATNEPESPAQAGSAQAAVRFRNLPYGSSPKEKLDVYTAPGAVDAPMILMVHGGGWAFGDKSNRGLVRNKVKHFVPAGVVVISVNYPLVPSVPPDGQADSVAAAIAYAQTHAVEWGGDPDNLVIMGHSAGGHLVALVSANSDRYPDLRPWRGTVVLDSAALDLVARMEDRPPPLFRRAFGSDPAYWASVSPLLALHRSTEPLLLVCASRRSDSCPQAQVFATAASSFGTEVHVLPQHLTHRQINVRLGRPGDYTDAVDTFLNGAWEEDPHREM